MRIRLVVAAAAAALVVATNVVVLSGSAEATLPGVIRLDENASFEQGNAKSYDPSASRDGTLVTFFSYAENLDRADPGRSTGMIGNQGDVYVKNSVTGDLEVVSLNPSGVAGNNLSWFPTISADGRYVAFVSYADDLVPNDTNGYADVFRRDLVNHTTELVSRATNGDQTDGPTQEVAAISADGRYVAFPSYATNLTDPPASHPEIYLRDMVAGTTVLVSQTISGEPADGLNYSPSISDDGRFIAYVSSATELVEPDPIPDVGTGVAHVYVWDNRDQRTVRVSVNNRGEPGDAQSSAPAISGDGRSVAFQSRASNLGLRDPGHSVWQVFVRDLITQVTDPISLNGNYTFAPANDNSQHPSISDDGRYVGFDSLATNLIANDTNGDWDVFVRDRWHDTTVRVSRTEAGHEVNGFSRGVITPDGRKATFWSAGTNVVVPDRNGLLWDVFLTAVPQTGTSPDPVRTLPRTLPPSGGGRRTATEFRDAPAAGRDGPRRGATSRPGAVRARRDP